MRLDTKVEGCTPDNLINQTHPGTDVFSVTLKGGQGILLRGTVLAANDEAKEMVTLGTTGEGLTANCILCDNTDTGKAPEGTPDAELESVHAIAYRTGHFNRNSLIVANEYAMTEKDEENLRKGGIILDDAI